MGLFKKKETNIFKKENNILTFPKDDIDKNHLVNSFIDSILELGDEDDVKIILKKVSENFYKKNKSILLNDILIKSDDFELIVNILNMILISNNLGSIKIEISKSDKKVQLIHYNFTLNNKYAIVFLEEFYKLFFSELLEKEVLLNVIKKERDEIIFEINS